MAPLRTADGLDLGGRGGPPVLRVGRAGEWTAERIVMAMTDWQNRFGHPPRSYEWAPSTARAAGLLPNEPARWEIEYPRWPSTGTVAARFGTWCNGLRAAGMPARIPDHELPRVERLHAARRLHASGMSLGAIADLLGVGKSTVFGYIRATPCPSCGGPLVSGVRCAACTPRKRPAATRAEVLEALRSWNTEHGRPPHQEDWGRRAGPDSPWRREWPRWPSASSVFTQFGSWNEALLAAGLPLQRHGAWARNEIVWAIQHWAAEHDGTPPRYADFRDTCNRARWPDPKTAAAHFGSWRAALAAAGFHPRRSGPSVDSAARNRP
jgi:hypothetical protein